MWLTRLAVGRPVTVLMFLLSMLVLGAISFSRLPLEFLPQTEFPFIGVSIPYDNGVPSQVEREIARPVEEVLATLGGIKETFSYSGTDQCFVGVQFEWGRDVNVMRLEVKEKLDQIRPELPADVRDIFLFTFDTADIPVVEGRISATGRDLSGSYELLQQRVISRLQRVPGVGRVTIDGVAPAEVSIYLNLTRIKQHRVDIGELFRDLGNNNLNLTVGKIYRNGLRFDVRAVGAMAGVDELERMPINDRGLRLTDIANVVYGEPLLTYGRFLNREPAIAFEVQKSSDANVVEVVRAVESELRRINEDPALEGITVLTFFNQADEITNGLNGLLQGGLMGSVLAVAVLYFFLRRLGTTLIIAAAIPLSVIGTGCYLYLSGGSLNILSMMGLMLGVGMLVDNAVVVLESIYRHMGTEPDPVSATMRGTKEVIRAVVSSTLTTVIVFAPIIFGGRSELVVWLKSVGITISVTLVFSLLVSITLIPLMTARLLRGGDRSVARNPLVERATDVYVRLLRWTAVRHPWITGVPIAICVLALTGGLMAVTGFKPDVEGNRGIQQRGLTVRYEFSDNLSYTRTREYVQKVEAVLQPRLAEFECKDIYSYYSDNEAATRIYFAEKAPTEKRLLALTKRLREALPELAGVKFLLGEDQSGGGGPKRIDITVYGEDSEELSRIAHEVKRRLELEHALADVTTDIERGAEEVQVRVDPALAQRYGTSPAGVAELMGITFRGVNLPRIRGKDREIDLGVILQPEDRQTVEGLRALTVGIQDGREVTLDQVATTVMGRGANRITRQNQKTAVTVRAGFEGEELSDGLDLVRRTMESLHFPAGYGWNFGSDIQQAREQQNEMGINALLAIICVYMVMASLFESLLHPAVVMFCLPFASLGVVWLMIATATPFNIMAMIGMVILIGVVVNNGIVLVDHINNHRRDGAPIDEAILRGGRERFRPILMTATTTVLGLIPLAAGRSSIGQAELYPMARAIIGGLTSSTLLTLVMLPTYYQLAERTRARMLGLGGWMSRRIHQRPV